MFFWLDALSNAALVAATACGIGSVRGYDELVPKTLDVVRETRLYKIYDGDGEFISSHFFDAI